MPNIRDNALLDTTLRTLRGALSGCPEVANGEVLTAATIETFLQTYSPNRILTGLGGHGVAAVYEGRQAGPTVLLRCELDALPCDESSKAGALVTSPGAHHRCGHDGHMAIVAGMAPLLHSDAPSCGRVVLLFQPAEETGQGAARVIADPSFEEIRPDFALSMHNLPGYPSGKIVYRTGTFASASVGMQVHLTGHASHAAEPEKARSPSEALSRLLTALPKLSQIANDPYRLLTVTHARMGRMSFGVTPGRATLCATLRGASGQALQSLRLEAEHCVRDAAEAEALLVDIQWAEEFPATLSDPALVAVLKQSCRQRGIKASEVSKPFRWSEDFGHFTAICPTLYFGLGIGKSAAALHHPDYSFPDEAIMVGLDAFHTTTQSILSGHTQNKAPLESIG